MRIKEKEFHKLHDLFDKAIALIEIYERKCNHPDIQRWRDIRELTFKAAAAVSQADEAQDIPPEPPRCKLHNQPHNASCCEAYERGALEGAKHY